MLTFLSFAILALEIFCANGAAPIFNPSVYYIYVGLNMTQNTVLTTLTATDADNDPLKYGIGNTGGASYFDIDTSSGSVNLVLKNLLDVEYGEINWSFKVTASDGTDKANATVNVTTYQSTTTSTSTQPPPGYDWFADTDNKILFVSVMAFVALLTSVCVLCCWKFHRDGTCLPESCPTYKQCRRSARRSCNCPIPWNFYEKKKKKKKKSIKKEEKAKTKKVKPPPPPPKVSYTEEKEDKTDKESKVTGGSKTKKKGSDETRNGAVTPISIGNVSLHDVGMDRARTPGFNAPTATAYGGKRVGSPKLFKKRKP